MSCIGATSYFFLSNTLPNVHACFILTICIPYYIIHWQS
jgi:hypothetical protein